MLLRDGLSPRLRAMLLLTAQALGLAALAVDPGHLAVYEPEATRGEIAAALSPVGPVTIEAWPVRGWWLVGLADGDPRHAELALERLTREGRVDFVSPVRTGLDGGPVFATPDLLLRFRAGTPESVRESVFASLAGFSLVETRFGDMDDAYRLHSSSPDARVVIAAAEALARRDDVRFAEPDCVFTGRGGSIVPIALPPNDLNFSNAWWLSNQGQTGGVAGIDLGALQAWPRMRGTSSTILAVIDTGVDAAHPDLLANQLAGTDLTSDGPAGQGAPVNAFDNHGTPVAGCAVAVLGNALGASGIAPESRFVSLRAFISVAADGSWTSATSWTVNALASAQALGARVTNNSNTYGFTSTVIDQKYLDTRNAGLVHFASAGNAGATAVDYPASLPTVNGIGSIGSTGAHSGFSNIGTALGFVAPGEAIFTTDRVGSSGWNTTGDFTLATGTSFASPMAAGIALLVLSADSSLSPAQVESALIGSCLDLGTPGQDVVYGHGLINAVRALDQLCTPPTSYCIGAPNTVGPGASITAVGVPTACLDALTLVVTGCPPNGFGVFFLGNAAVQAPFGNGFRCVGGAVWRFPVVATSVFGDVAFTPAWSSLPTGFGVSPGDVRYAQLWYRDAFAPGAPFNLSDGLQIQFCY